MCVCVCVMLRSMILAVQRHFWEEGLLLRSPVGKREHLNHIGILDYQILTEHGDPIIIYRSYVDIIGKIMFSYKMQNHVCV